MSVKRNTNDGNANLTVNVRSRLRRGMIKWRKGLQEVYTDEG